jgi:hypothetical protein
MIRAALHALARHLPTDAIDELWIFPTRRSGKNESAVVVASAFVEPDDERRRIITSLCTLRSEAGKKKPDESITEQGIVPAERIARLVDGVMRRLDEELAALTPRQIHIGGETTRWEELLAESASGSGAPDKASAADPTPAPVPAASRSQ